MITVQLTTFRPLATTNQKGVSSSAVVVAAAGSGSTDDTLPDCDLRQPAPLLLTSSGSAPGGGILKSSMKMRMRSRESSDASDYENLSSCTSGGRYATLPPPQSQSGTHPLASAGSSRIGDQQQLQHYSTAAVGAMTAAVIGGGGGRATTSDCRQRHHHSSSMPPGGGGGTEREQQQQQTLSLQRPSKRSHWVNHNGRPSDVLARVLQANQDWLDTATITSIASPGV